MKTFVLAFVLSGLCVAWISMQPRQEASRDANTLQDAKADALHGPFDALLRVVVHDGTVEYGRLKERRAVLEAYQAALARTDPEGMGRKEKLSFWINAYNAFTVQLMLDHEPVASIHDIPSSQRWKARRWVVNGEKISLDAIEHEVLRPMGDPRIHFAIVCASLSCPDLASRAFLPSRIDRQLDEATRRFLANDFKGLRTATEEGTLWGENQVLYLSPIFDWFDEDFERDGSLVDWVLPWAPEAAQAFIRQHRDDLKIRHLEYDWSLNGRWEKPADGTSPGER